MPYQGDSMGGFVGNYRTLALLEQVRPAANNAGRVATVGIPQDTSIYYISQGAGWQPLVVSNTDPVTGKIALLAGGSALDMTAKRAARVAFIGDSITAWDCDNTAKILGNAWPTYFTLSMQGSVTHCGNFAVGGTTSAQALATQLPQVLALVPTITHCFVATGTNDTDPIAQTQPNVLAICAALVAANIIPIIRNMPPSGTAAIGAPTVTATPSTTGGTLAAATYGYRVSSVNGAGETLAATEVTATTTGSTGSVSLTWPIVLGATGYRIYGRTQGAELLLHFNNNSGGQSRPVCMYLDDGSATPSGALPGSNTTAVALTSPVRTKITTGNAVLNRIAQAGGYPFYDAYTFFVDASTGMYRTGATRDGTHPTDKEFKLLGADMAVKLVNIFAPYVPYLAGDNSDPTCLFTNPLMLTNNGSYPAGWSPYNGAACESIVAGTGGKGSAYQINRLDYTGRYGSSPVVTTGFSIGDRLRFSGKITVTGADTNGGQPALDLKFVGVSPTQYLISMPLNSDTPGGTCTFVFESVVPTGTTSLTIDTAIGYGPVTLKIEDLTVQNLTVLGIL